MLVNENWRKHPPPIPEPQLPGFTYEQWRSSLRGATINPAQWLGLDDRFGYQRRKPGDLTESEFTPKPAPAGIIVKHAGLRFAETLGIGAKSPTLDVYTTAASIRVTAILFRLIASAQTLNRAANGKGPAAAHQRTVGPTFQGAV